MFITLPSILSQTTLNFTVKESTLNGTSVNIEEGSYEVYINVDTEDIIITNRNKKLEFKINELLHQDNDNVLLGCITPENDSVLIDLHKYMSNRIDTVLLMYVLDNDLIGIEYKDE